MEVIMPKKFNRSPAAIRRRETVVKRLDNQLLTGYKTVTNKETNEITTEPLTKEDRMRIEKELETLKTRL